ncbi:MAG: hypothetical protein HLUCCA01_06785 [Bacteroidetes bacterium HLUCCA01]|nr:MAG: hypothetical protein HLUCCA01_06785 [Bacteroidetes bacterium HLUCCA01]
MNTIDPNAYNQPIPEFDGYSTYEMAWILFNPIQPDSPMHLNPLTEDLIRRIPMLNVALFLMNMLHDSGEIKLTATGNLPLKLVKAMHEMAQVPDERLDTGMSKIRSQQDVILVDLLRALLDFARLTKKRHNKLSLTRAGQKLLNNPDALLRTLLLTHGFEFPWSHYDYYDNEEVGQFGWAFSLRILALYGGEPREDRWYARRYFTAFPEHYPQESLETIDTVDWNPIVSCYATRTFNHFAMMYGLVTYTRGPFRPGFGRQKEFFQATALLHELFYFKEHVSYIGAANFPPMYEPGR